MEKKSFIDNMRPNLRIQLKIQNIAPKAESGFKSISLTEMKVI